MNNSEPSISAIRRLEREADWQLRLVETFEHLAVAEEAAAGRLKELGLSAEADELLKSAASHYRRAAEETRRVKDKRKEELELLGDIDDSV